MEAIHDYLLAMVAIEKDESVRDVRKRILEHATVMQNNLMGYIRAFNESYRQDLFKIIMYELIENALLYKDTLVGDGFTGCILGLQSEMKEQGFECFNENQIKLDVDCVRIIIRDPLMRLICFGPAEEGTPSEAISKKELRRRRWKTVKINGIIKEMLNRFERAGITSRYELNQYLCYAFQKVADQELIIK